MCVFVGTNLVEHSGGPGARGVQRALQLDLHHGRRGGHAAQLVRLRKPPFRRHALRVRAIKLVNISTE